MKYKFFGKNITPACSYCQNGRFSEDGSFILCEKMGAVLPYHSCRKYVYNPTKRVPSKPLKLEHYKAEDFAL